MTTKRRRFSNPGFSSGRWAPALSMALALLCAAAVALPAAAQEKAEAYTVLTLDPQGLVTEGSEEIRTGGGGASDIVGTTTHGILGGGGQSCTGATCISVAGGEVDDCNDCDTHCPDPDHNDIVVWSTLDIGTSATGSVVCAVGGWKWESGDHLCRSDHLGTHCKDCGGCWYDASYCAG